MRMTVSEILGEVRSGAIMDFFECFGTKINLFTPDSPGKTSANVTWCITGNRPRIAIDVNLSRLLGVKARLRKLKLDHHDLIAVAPPHQRLVFQELDPHAEEWTIWDTLGEPSGTILSYFS